MGFRRQETGIGCCSWEGWVREVSLEKTILWKRGASRCEERSSDGVRRRGLSDGLFPVREQARLLLLVTAGSLTSPFCGRIPRMLLFAPKAAIEAELKSHLPDAQAYLRGLWGPASPASPGSFLPVWVLCPWCSFTSSSEQDWKTSHGLPSILC